MTSSTAAEVYALSYLVREHSESLATSLNNMLGGVNVDYYEDNQACLAVVAAGYSQSLRWLPRTTRLSLGFLSEYMSIEGRRLQYARTNNMKADMMTKCLTGRGLENAHDLCRVGNRLTTFSVRNVEDTAKPSQQEEEEEWQGSQ